MFEFSERITRCRAQIPMVVWTCFWPLSTVIYWSYLGMLLMESVGGIWHGRCLHGYVTGISGCLNTRIVIAFPLTSFAINRSFLCETSHR
jgi:hypothetical protein